MPGLNGTGHGRHDRRETTDPDGERRAQAIQITAALYNDAPAGCGVLLGPQLAVTVRQRALPTGVF